MKHLFTSASAAALAMAFAIPAIAADHGDAFTASADNAGYELGAPVEFDRKGRGRGGRSKPRIPGGSGCDDPEDIIEHPECSG